MKNEYLRMDYFFSYWIFIWFILYYLVIKSNIVDSKTKQNIQTKVNPKFALYVALFENLCIFIYLLFHKPTMNIIIKYVMII